MLRMIFTKTNRYEIKDDNLNAFTTKIKDTFISITIDDTTYLTDGHIYLLPLELTNMESRAIIPFPEHVSSLLKADRFIKNYDNVVLDLKDTLNRPKLSDPVFL